MRVWWGTQVGESGWTEALNLESRADLDQAQDFSVRPVLIRARMPSWGAVAEVVARLEVVGSSFERTMVRFPAQLCNSRDAFACAFRETQQIFKKPSRPSLN